MAKDKLKKVVGRHFVSQFLNGNLYSNTEIIKEEYDRIREVNRSVRNIQYYKNKFLECHLNHSDYFKTIDKYLGLLQDPASYEIKYNHELARMDINRVFNNFVISFKALMEHSENMICRSYGKETDQFKAFKRFSSGFYDRLFSYRLFIRLRNYTTHYSQPINLALNANQDRGVELKPFFKKSELLRFKEIKSKLKYDLRAYNDSFPVNPLMTDIKTFLDLYYANMINILWTREGPNIEELLHFFYKYSDEEGLSMSVGIPSSFDGKNLNMDFISLEIPEALIIRRIVDNIT
ncbi:MAG: hypothetical protein IPL46_07835 [Saprospiraceae bacterium]|nr:hypothetical protein [Saprospiraceae bacterium]